MSLPVDVLEVMAGLIDDAAMDGAITQGHKLIEARAAVAELMAAAENALGNLTTCGTPRPIKGKERAHAMLTAALARCGAK